MPTWPITSITELLEPTIKHMGYELYSLDQSGHSGRTLRISIDHNEPITIEDCERFSGKRVNVRYRTGESETVVEGPLVAVDEAGIAVQAHGARGRAPVTVHIAWDDVVAGRLAVAI